MGAKDTQAIRQKFAKAMDNFAMAKGRADLQVLNAVNKSMEDIVEAVMPIIEENLKLSEDNIRLRAELDKHQPKQPPGDASKPPEEN